MNTDRPVQGWPFLIARGRRRGYSVLLAPGFLIAEQDYGFLEHAVGPVRDGAPCHTATVTTPRGRRICLVWSDHPATTADEGAIRDEHSRPLRLLSGFLCTDTAVTGPSSADLAAARAAASDTYLRFLADEERFTIEESAPFGVRSNLARPASPPQVRPAPRPVRLTGRVAVLGVAVLAVIVTVVAIVIGSSGGGGGSQPPVCPTTPPSATATTGATTVPPTATSSGKPC